MFDIDEDEDRENIFEIILNIKYDLKNKQYTEVFTAFDLTWYGIIYVVKFYEASVYSSKL
jgi:hypothetical protein